MTTTTTRFLAQTRPVLLRAGAGDPRTDRIADFFEDILGRMKLPDHHWPALHTVASPDAIVETLAVDGDAVIVYDHYLAQSFFRLTRFALEGWPADLVMAWACRPLGITFARLGRFGEALVSIHASRELPESTPPVYPAVHDGLLNMSLQEYFVLAHECAHTALEHGDPRLVARTGFNEVVDRGIRHCDDLPTTPAQRKADIQAAARRAMAAALRTMRTTAQVTPLDQSSPRAPTELGAYLVSHPHLYEEFRCDVIATEVTMKFAKVKLGLNPRDVLPAILQALLNLDALEHIRQHGRSLISVSRPGQVMETSLRKAFWQWHAPMAYGDHAGGAEAILQTFNEVERRFRDNVMDIVLDPFPRQFIEYLLKVPASQLEAMRSDAEVRRYVRDWFRALVPEQGAEDTAKAAEERYQLALQLGQANDIDGLRRALAQADSLGHGDAAGTLGALYIARRKRAEAEAAYRRGTERGSLMSRHNLGLMLLEDGKTEEAFRTLLPCLDAAQAEIVEAAQVGIEMVCEQLHDADEAFNLAQGAVKEKAPFATILLLGKADALGSAPAAELMAAIHHRQGDHASEEDAYRRAADRGSPSGKYNLGIVLARKGDLFAAQALWRECLISDDARVASAARQRLDGGLEQ